MKKFILICALLFGIGLPSVSEAAFTFISSAKSVTVGANSTTTDEFDSTGANTLIAFQAWYNAGTTPTLDDSVTHAMWTCKTIYEDTFGLLKTQLCSLHISTTDAAHTVTSAGTSAYTGLIVLALSGGGASPDDTGDNDGDYVSATQFDFDSITPSEDDCIVILGIGSILGDFTVDLTGTDYILVEQLAFGGSTNAAVWVAYKIQTMAEAEAPSFDDIIDNSFFGSEHGSIGSFKTSGAAPPASNRNRCLLLHVCE